MRVAFLLAVLGCLSAGSASAQTLVEEPSEPIPFLLTGTVLGPIEEGGALLVFGRDLADGSMRSVRADAVRVSAGAGEDLTRVASVVRCGATRWRLELEVLPRRYQYSLRGDGPAVWSRSMRRDPAPHTSLVCAGPTPRIVFLDDGEIVVSAPRSTAPELRVRLMPSGQHASLSTASAGAATIAFVLPVGEARMAELVRIEGGVITHRVPIEAQRFFVADGARAIAAHAEPDGGLVLRTISTADLSTVSTSRVAPSQPGRGVQPNGAWAAPGSAIVVATSEHWFTQEWVSIPEHTQGRNRYERGHHSESWLRALDPRSGSLGPALSLGADSPGIGGFVGAELVLFAAAEATGSSSTVVELRGAQVRRFRIVP